MGPKESFDCGRVVKNVNKKRFGKWCTPESIKLKYYWTWKEPNNNRSVLIKKKILGVGNPQES